jgi:glutamate 5-kinase
MARVTPHRAHHVPFFKGAGYHPKIPLKPAEESEKSVNGIASNFLVWETKGIEEKPPEDYPKYAPDLSGIDTVVLKVSSNIIAHKRDKRECEDTSRYNIRCISEEIFNIGLPVVIVTGGARGLSDKYFEDISFGQEMLEKLWGEYIPEDYFSLVRPSNIRDKIPKYHEMLGRKIPIVNEEGISTFLGANDEVTDRIAFGLHEMGRNVLIAMLSDMEGVHTEESYKNRFYDDIIRIVRDARTLSCVANEERSRFGTGGLVTKLKYIAEINDHGIPVIMFNGQYCNHDLKYQKRKRGAGRVYTPLQAAFGKKVVGTWFLPN